MGLDFGNASLTENNQWPGDFAREADVARQLISVDAGQTTIASIHKENTSPRRISEISGRRLISLKFVRWTWTGHPF